MNELHFLTEPQFLWAVTVASICSVSCALVGCFLVLKRMSLMGDAINHGLLPGIVLAVLISGQITSLYLLLGAMFFGLLTAFLSQTLHSWGNVDENASLGVVFTSFFALGVFLISALVKGADLDTDCVFMGNLEHVTFLLMQGDYGVLVSQLLALALTLAFILLAWKEMKIAVFDPALATALGYNAPLLHYILIALVAGVTVVAFEAVGSILVLAMLIVPAATAQLLTDRLVGMLLWATAAALISSFVGCFLAFLSNTNSAGMMAVVAGGQLALVVLLAPRHGILAKILHNLGLSLRMAGEDILAALYRSEETDAPPPALTQPEHGFSRLTVRLGLARLVRKGWIRRNDQGNGWLLTDQGRGKAREIVRAHRLWEAFLGENFALPLDHLHAPASVMEHFLGPQLQSQIAEQLHEPVRDPHGKAIPKDNSVG
jgi:manganese/zinc/iron transport system permease protein